MPIPTKIKLGVGIFTVLVVIITIVLLGFILFQKFEPDEKKFYKRQRFFNNLLAGFTCLLIVSSGISYALLK